MEQIIIPELIAPAGSLKKLALAYRMGADACYLGSSAFSMRTGQNDIGQKDLKEARKTADRAGKKLYVCVNSFPHNKNLPGLEKHLRFLKELKPDAVVLADPSILEMAQEIDLGLPLHLSVQTSTANWMSVRFWYRQGVRRVILARELSLAEIAEIRANVPEMELEAFVHGSVCMAYSGRCFLSSVFSNRDANQGMCAHNCRDPYTVTAATIANQKFPEQELLLEEDEHGSHLMSSRDMCLLPHLQKLIATGIHGFKIEGRNKSEYYLAVVTRTYRKAIDDALAGKPYDPLLMEELEKTNNRGFFSGFYFPEREEKSEQGRREPGSGGAVEYYLAQITGVSGPAITVNVKGKIRTGDRLRLLTEKAGEEVTLTVTGITNHRDEAADEVSSGVTAKLAVHPTPRPDWADLPIQRMT